MKTQWKDTPQSTAEQIEIGLRQRSNRLDAVIANCRLMIANSDNKQLKQFAEIIIKLATN